MALRADELLASVAAPHEFHLNTVAGEIFAPGAPWPTVEIVTANAAPVKRLVYQTIVARATRPGDPEAPVESVLIGRLVAELADGAEVEIQRDVLPADADDPAVDLSTCAACGAPIIVAGEARVEDGAAYHPRCWSDTDGD